MNAGWSGECKVRLEGWVFGEEEIFADEVKVAGQWTDWGGDEIFCGRGQGDFCGRDFCGGGFNVTALDVTDLREPGSKPKLHTNSAELREEELIICKTELTDTE
jgi:hypothetical protein